MKRIYSVKLIIALLGFACVFSSFKTASGQAVINHSLEAEQVNPEAPIEQHTQEKLSQSAPFVYYLNWVLLGVTFIAACFYCLWVYEKGRPKNEGLGLAFFFIAMAIAIYAMNQLPEVQRHFDITGHGFVDGFQESTTIAFIKFFYKMALGVFLMIYGLVGREHH